MGISEKIIDAKDTLERTIGFVGNCDMKASIMLAFAGIILSLIFNDMINGIIISACTNLEKISVCLKYPFIVIIAGCGIAFLFGMYKLSCTITAKIAPSGKNSKIYFADIAQTELSHYKSLHNQQSEEEILEDLLNQIHINATICTKKYNNYNSGLITIRNSVGIFIFIVCLSYFMV